MPLVQALSRRVELHLMLEAAPESWRTGAFDVDIRDLPAGVVPGVAVAECFPEAVQAYWREVASFSLVVHQSRRSIHPATWWVGSRAMRHIRKLRPDIVHFDDSSLRLCGVVPGLRGIPIIFSVHDPEPHSGENDWRTNLAYRLTFRQGAGFILHSRALKNVFEARFGVSANRVDTVHLGPFDIYQHASQALTQASAQPTVLFFGRISVYKGLEVLYAAAPLVADKVPGVRFVVAGRPVHGYVPPRPPALPNGGRIEVIERYIGNAEVGALFGEASVVACPYLDATQSGVVLTAYAFDRPVVATAVGGMPEYVHEGETGYLVPPGDADALANALVRILADSDARARLIEGVKQARAREFNWNRAADQTLEAYSKVVSGPILRSPHPRVRIPV